MTAVQDVSHEVTQELSMLTSLLHLDPIVVTRLRRMREVKRPAKPVDIFKRWDNRLRADIDSMFCLRRNKYVTRLGLYYWIQARDKACQECAGAREQEWIPREQPYIVMMKASPMARGGLDFARVAVGLGVDIACFGSLLKTGKKGPVEAHEHRHGQAHAHSKVKLHDDSQELVGDEGEALEFESMTDMVDDEFSMLRDIDRVDADDQKVYTGYENLYVGVDAVFAAHEQMIKAPEKPTAENEAEAEAEEFDYPQPSDFSHLSPDHHFWSAHEIEEIDRQEVEKQEIYNVLTSGHLIVSEDDITAEETTDDEHNEYAPDQEPMYAMQNNRTKSKTSVRPGQTKTKRAATKVSAGKAVTGGTMQKPGSSQSRPVAKSKFLMSA